MHSLEYPQNSLKLKNMRVIIFIAAMWFLSGCTSGNKDLKSLAEARGETYIKLKMSQEAYGSSDVSPFLKETYIEYMVKKANIKAKEPVIAPSGTAASVDLVMTLYSPLLRKTILGVAAKAAPNKVRSFNFTDAIGLISQQSEELKADMTEQPLVTLQFAKTESGWVLQED